MPVAVSLYDESGNMLRPWAEAGYECHCYDLLNNNDNEEVGKGIIYYHQANLLDPRWLKEIPALRPVFLSGFPPCTDLASSGSRHFMKKLLEDPLFQEKAAELALIVMLIATEANCPYMFENPVGSLSVVLGPFDHTFDPCDFGSYLPEDDIHPRWPEYIAPRDAYKKKTCIWSGRGFVFPPKAPIYCPDEYSTQHKMLGGKSEKTKRIRSETPRGFAKAVFMSNRKSL